VFEEKVGRQYADDMTVDISLHSSDSMTDNFYIV
jgi:hypothetical protein